MLKAAAAIFTFILGVAAHNAFAQSAADLGLASSADKIRPVLLGSKAPDAALKTLDGKSTTFKDQLGGKPAVVVFYRGGWCPYCTTQLRDLRVILKDLGDLGYRVIAVSPDGVEALTATMGKEKFEYTLLSDGKADLIRALGIAFQVDDETYKKYQGYGIDLEKASGGEKHHALPAPTALIYDQAGVLQFSYVNPDYTARVPGTLLLAAAQMVAGKKQFVKPKNKPQK